MSAQVASTVDRLVNTAVDCYENVEEKLKNAVSYYYDVAVHSSDTARRYQAWAEVEKLQAKFEKAGLLYDSAVKFARRK